MTQARFVDAAEGWTIYRQHRGDISLFEINQALRSRGYRAVSPRTFDHYGKLRRLGYDDYVSINRLDLRHAADPVFDVVDRSRYMSQDLADAPATLFIPTSDRVEVLHGEVVAISEDAAAFVTAAVDELQTAGRSKKYFRGVLRFDRVDVERAVGVRDVVDRDGTARAVLEFRSLLDVDLVLDHDQHRVRSVLSIDLGPAPSIYDVTNVWKRSFDLIESCSGIGQTLIRSLPESRRRRLASTRVERLSLRSPLEVGALIDPLVIGIVLYIFRYVRTEMEGVRRILESVQRTRLDEAEESRRSERHSYEMKARKLDDLKTALEIGAMVSDLDRRTRDHLGIEETEQFHPNPGRIEALKDQAIEAAADLILGASGEVTIQADSPDEDNAPGGVDPQGG